MTNEAELLRKQLEAEAAARADLEDMLVRIEKHFKDERQARKQAESEAEALRVAADSAVANGEAAASGVAAAAAANDDARMQMEEERAAMDAELHALRVEAKRAHAALARVEEHVRAQESAERMKLEAQHKEQIKHLEYELRRARAEMDARSDAMAAEMQAWRQRAELAMQASDLANAELQDRRKELLLGAEGLDKLARRLHMGKEAGVELRGAIEFRLAEAARQREMDRRHWQSLGMDRGMTPGAAEAAAAAAVGKRVEKAAKGRPGKAAASKPSRVAAGPSAAAAPLPPIVAEAPPAGAPVGREGAVKQRGGAFGAGGNKAAGGAPKSRKPREVPKKEARRERGGGRIGVDDVAEANRLAYAARLFG